MRAKQPNTKSKAELLNHVRHHIYPETTEQARGEGSVTLCVYVCECACMCVVQLVMEGQAKILAQRGQHIVFACLIWHKAASLHCIPLSDMETKYMVMN